MPPVAKILEAMGFAFCIYLYIVYAFWLWEKLVRRRPMKFVLKIDIENPAFGVGQLIPELSRLLREASERVQGGGLKSKIISKNGNTVGHHYIEESEHDDDSIS